MKKYRGMGMADIYYESIVSKLPIGYALLEAIQENEEIIDFKFLEVNELYKDNFNPTMRHELHTMTINDLIQKLNLNTLKMMETLKQTLKQGEKFIENVYFKTPNKHYNIKLNKINETTIIVFFIDITEKNQLKEYQKEFKAQHQILRTALDATPDMVAVKDLNGRYLIVNQAVKDHFKQITDQVEGKLIEDLYPAWEIPKVIGLDREAIEKKESFSRKVTIPSSETDFVLSDITRAPIKDEHGQVKGVIAIGRDVSEEEKARKALETKHKEIKDLAEKYRKLSYKDDLTTLFNRRKFYEDIKAINNSEYHLYICDLNNFKLVNDTLGHHAGDQVLYKFSTYLRRVLKPCNGYAYRIGGDEFAIIVPQNTIFNFKDKILEINEKLKSYHKDLSLAYGEIDLSIKESLDNKALDSILQQADKNLYTHKKLNKSNRNNKE